MWIISKDNLHKIKNLDFIFPLILGAFLSLGNPPFSFPYIILIVLVVIGYFWLKKNYSPKKSFFFGFFFGFGYFTFSLVWIIEPFLVEPTITVILAPFVLIILSGILSLFWGSAFFFSSYKNDFKNKNISIFKLAICFSSAEILRSFLFTGFPWVLLGLAFIDTPISQALSIFGPYWLTSVIIFLCLIIPIGKIGILLSITGFSLLNIYGSYRDNYVLDEEINKQIRIIQPNILQKNKWKKDLEEVNFSKLIKLSNINSENVDILIWPETSVPFFLEYKKNFQNVIFNTISKPIILGARRYDKSSNKLYNSAYYLNANGKVEQIYDKKHLVPFGEYVPFNNILNIFVETGIENNGITGFSVGKKTNEIVIDNSIKISLFICYESIFSSEIDSNIINSDFIVHLTNDAWFGSFNGPQQHIIQIRARAIEQGLSVLRSANTGISALIDPYGKILKKIPLNIEGYLDVKIPKKIDETLYSKFGSKNWNLFLICLFALFYFLCFKKSNLKS
tara:strand:+ start:334 stop:1854 length:1521 start_codon:yes stop_codon:yes gene_type:complete